MTNPIDAIENIIEEGQDPWEALVNAGIEASDGIDGGKFTIGDAACLVSKEYGQDTIGKFAYAIKREKARVAEYRTVCSFWDRKNSPREDIRANYPIITYTHFREAMRLEDIEDATDFLMECVENDWDVTAAREVLKERLGDGTTPPKKLLDCQVELSSTVKVANEGFKSQIAFFIEPFDLQKLEPLDTGRLFRLVVYEVKGEDDDEHK